MTYRLSADETRDLAARLRASFASPEAADSALELLPELVALCPHLLVNSADITRLAEVLHPVLMALPTYPLHDPDDGLCLYDLAPLALAATRASDLTGLLRAFLPNRLPVTLGGFLLRTEGSGQPFNVPGEYYRAEIGVASPMEAEVILRQLGLHVVPPELGQAFIATLGGVNVWISLAGESGNSQLLVLEVHDAQAPYTITRQAFESARRVNQILLRRLLSQPAR